MNTTDVYKIKLKNKRKKRLGCGESSGHGKTSCRGGKGQTARSGVSFSPTFEGGRMPLVRRMPKRGFTNIFKEDLTVVNLGQLDGFSEGATVDADSLKKMGIVKKVSTGIKILGDGTVAKRLTVKAHAFSRSAIEKITKAGGVAERIGASPSPAGKAAPAQS